MEEKQSLLHYQVPNRMAEKGITPKDALIYLSIKAFDGKNGCFPSLQKIAEKSGASIPTIRSSIDRLKNAKYIKVKKKGRCNYYEFNDYNKFEPFSPEFLDNKDITFTTKSYLVASQQYMYTDIKGLGKMSYSNRKLSDMINMPESTIRKCDLELKRKECLETFDNETRDLETGCKTNTKVYNLDKLKQSVIWLLRDHEKRIRQNEIRTQQNEEDIQQNKDDIIELKKQVESQSKQIESQSKQIESQKKLIQKLLNDKAEEKAKNTYIM